MNDRPLMRLLEELDAELIRKIDPATAASEIHDCIDARVLGAVMRSAGLAL